MIYTLTWNPSLDYIVSVENFKLGQTNRTSSEKIFPGGKGINVSIVLHNMGIDSLALGAAAGFTGREILRRLDEMGLAHDFLLLREGLSRINVKLKSAEGTEINGRGPYLDNEGILQVIHKMDGLKDGDVLVLSGSMPDASAEYICEQLRLRLQGRKVLIAADVTKELLFRLLDEWEDCRPFLVKPNHHELGEMFDVEFTDREEVIPYARKLQKMGAANVLVSLAAEGAVLAAENGKVYEAAAPEGRCVNSVGAGDSMVAGFLAGWLERRDYLHAFHMGIAAGSASAFSEGLADRKKIEEVYRKVTEAER